MNRTLRFRLFEKGKWFVAEISVVVVGVLIALALNSWLAGRQEAELRSYFISQISADVDTSIVSVQNALNWNTRMVDRSDSLIMAFSTPFADSVVLELTSMAAMTGEITTGAVRAFVETGSIRLLEDETLRSKLIDFLEVDARLYSEEQFAVEQWGADSFVEIYRNRHRIGHITPTIGISVKRFLQDPDMFEASQQLKLGFLNLTYAEETALTSLLSLDSLLSSH